MLHLSLFAEIFVLRTLSDEFPVKARRLMLLVKPGTIGSALYKKGAPGYRATCLRTGGRVGISNLFIAA